MSSSCKAAKRRGGLELEVEFCKLTTAHSNADERTSTSFGSNSLAFFFDGPSSEQLPCKRPVTQVFLVDSTRRFRSVTAFRQRCRSEALASAWTMYSINGLDSIVDDAMTRTMGDDGPNRRAKPATGPCNPSRVRALKCQRGRLEVKTDFSVNAQKQKRRQSFALAYRSDSSCSSSFLLSLDGRRLLVPRCLQFRSSCL